MSELLIRSLGCPNCGAAYEPETRKCPYCGSVLIVTSVAETFERSPDAHQASESLAKWRQRVNEDPENAEAHYALGLSYLNSKLRDAALEHLRKAVLLMPEAADIHHNLAITLLNDGNVLLESPEYAEAMKEIDYSIRLAPDFRESAAFKHFFLGRRLASVDITQALVEYSRAVENCPDIATLQNNLGSCYLDLENYAEADRCFQLAINLDPRYGVAYSNLCHLMAVQGKYAKGIDLGNKALSLMGPATPEAVQAVAHNNLSFCLWKAKRKSEAVEHAKKAIALDPANAFYQEHLQNIETSCFVVTATMGGYSHPWVIELSAFRDHVLTRSSPGKWVICCYSYVGPVFARLIAPSLVLRRLSLLLVVIPTLFIARLSSGIFAKAALVTGDGHDTTPKSERAKTEPNNCMYTDVKHYVASFRSVPASDTDVKCNEG